MFQSAHQSHQVHFSLQRHDQPFPNVKRCVQGLVAGTARIPALEKQNVDRMTEKLNIFQEFRPTLNDNVSSEKRIFLSVLVCIFYMQIFISFCHCHC